MNIKDVEDPIVPPGWSDQANVIYQRQSELESKYWQIENRPSQFIKVNDRKGQILIKDFLWRVIEEIGESLEAEELGEAAEKVREELADGLHFVVGLCVVLNSPDTFTKAWESFTNSMFMGTDPLHDFTLVIESAGLVGNCLKMKPWKQTDMLTDENHFNAKLEQFVYNYLMYCKLKGFNPVTLYSTYWKKSEVNLFRIRSKY